VHRRSSLGVKGVKVESFEQLESKVRIYSRSFPVVFATAEGYRLTDEAGRSYIDFFSGAGTLNYGHNNPRFKRQLIEYIERNGITHSLDMATSAKREFLERFNAVILGPRGLSYKVQFTGPTGTNAVEAALKLARKVTGRKNVVFFTQAFHGMTLGALAVTGNAQKRAGAGVPLANAVAMPFEGYPGAGPDTLAYLESMLADSGSGLDLPAAVIVETVQAEGGINVASWEWLRRLETMLRSFKVLLIVDDIQVGCGRTGPFFSFEPAGLHPDLICLSKSISGYGLPMALLLIAPELDRWSPGEHSGTFRGLNLAFVAAAAALSYWEDEAFSREIDAKAVLLRGRIEELIARHPDAQGEHRGRGLIQGLVLRRQGMAQRVARSAFRHGLIIETAGSGDEVLKILPPLTIDEAGLDAGLDLLEQALEESLALAPAAVVAVAAAS
jgi:diaminobutyrate-2-oxoglutarate transaminase